MLTNKLRVLVSKKKNRFQEDGYDLDLTYISDRIVAMGYPASGSEKIYRNDRDVVKQFLEQYHKNNYQIYNLCIERGYEESFFDMRVQRFPFEDHMPPPFSILLPCCQSLDAFLAKDPKNIAAIHCKAGKGRTGVIIAAYMVYLKLYKTANEALTVYGTIRTRDGKGVTINSQRRYVDYFAKCVADDYTFPQVDTAVVLRSIVMNGIPHFDKDQGSDPYFMIDTFKASEKKGNLTTVTTNIYDSRKHYKIQHYLLNDNYRIDDINLTLSGDVKVRFYDYNQFESDKKMFHVHFNTNFILDETRKSDTNRIAARLRFEKSELDGKARKDMYKNKYFDEDFYVQFLFEITDLGKKTKINICTVDYDPKNFGMMRHVSVVKHIQSKHGEATEDDDSDYGDDDE